MQSNSDSQLICDQPSIWSLNGFATKSGDISGYWWIQMLCMAQHGGDVDVDIMGVATMGPVWVWMGILT